MHRFPNWPQRLHRTIESAHKSSFAWGKFDCALHVCDCILAIVGIDPAAAYRGKYSDEAGAAKIYGENFANFIAGVCKEYKFPEVPVTFARRGDVVFLDNGTPQGAVGIVSTDGRFASCASDKGLVLVRIHRWKRAWNVG